MDNIFVTRSPSGYSGDEDASIGSCDQKWETKSRFTEYSITSSVVPRSEGSNLLLFIRMLCT